MYLRVAAILVVYLSVLSTVLSTSQSKSAKWEGGIPSQVDNDRRNESFDDEGTTAAIVLEELKFSIKTFCYLVRISPSNCSCEKRSILCEISDFQKKRRQNNNTKYSTFKRNHGFTVTYATVAAISAIIGIIGNGMVIGIAFIERKQISACKVHIAQLAVINFIFSAVQIANVMPLYWTNTWIYSKAMCKLMKGTLEMGSLLSSGFFQLITVERYLLIVHTFGANKMERQGRWIVLALFLFALVTIIPYIHGINIEAESQRCVNIIGDNRWAAQVYIWFAFIVYSLLPIVVTSTLVVKLIVHFSREESSSLVICRKDLNKRIMKHMLLIFFLFVLCTLPSRLVSISMDMASFQSSDLLLGFQFLSYILYSLQGTLNPILFSMLAREWRRNVSQVMRATWKNSPAEKIRISIASQFRISVDSNFRISINNQL